MSIYKRAQNQKEHLQLLSPFLYSCLTPKKEKQTINQSNWCWKVHIQVNACKYHLYHLTSCAVLGKLLNFSLFLKCSIYLTEVSRTTWEACRLVSMVPDTYVLIVSHYCCSNIEFHLIVVEYAYIKHIWFQKSLITASFHSVISNRSNT